MEEKYSTLSTDYEEITKNFERLNYENDKLKKNYTNLEGKYNGIYNENQIYRNDNFRLKKEMKELTDKL